MIWWLVAALAGFALGAVAYTIPMIGRERRRTLTWRLDTLPGWAVAWLDEVGLPMRFRLASLTPEQRLDLEFFLVVVGLWEKGLVDVEYLEGEGMRVGVSRRGMELARALENLEAEG